jgi:SAM-dependent MidA family methyltransferase
VTQLEKAIEAEIASSGPLSFERFMELALYHPAHGYYAAGARRTGWGGHFLTSPELDPAFGAVWARGFEHLWRQCGRPKRFELIELGPGEGGFAASVLESVSGAFARALHITLLERVPALRTRQEAVLKGCPRVSWSRSLRELEPAAAGCLFANEVLDNVPVRLVEYRSGRLWELFVGAANGELVLVPAAPADAAIARFLDKCGMRLHDGQRAEIGVRAMQLVSEAALVVTRGALVFVDYGDVAEGLVARPAGTLLSYSEGGVDDHVLAEPGTKDITAHVNWTSIANALRAADATVIGPTPQRDVLRCLGLDAIADELRARAEAASGIDVIRALSRRAAVAALSDRGGLGGLGVLVGLRGISPPEFLRA